jgi:hypothetical protein
MGVVERHIKPADHRYQLIFRDAYNFGVYACINLFSFLLVIQQEWQQIFCFRECGHENSHLLRVVADLDTGDFCCLIVSQYNVRA